LWSAANRERIRAHSKRCYARNKPRHLARTRRWAKANRERMNAWQRAQRAKFPEAQLVRSARVRARLKGLPFNLVPADVTIPALCPVLGVPMVRGTMYAPSLDRRVPENGYVKDNITVMSRRANTLKLNATVAELRAVAAWVSRA
jgi:hypothetical protein